MLLRGGAIQCAAMGARASHRERRRVIVISGPTGVGKSSVAIALAQRLGGEIISADSVQVYKGLNVGSAKTPMTERQDVPHHLLDILHPTQEYSVGNFFKDARDATETVLAKGRVPIVVGGTGLYLLWDDILDSLIVPESQMQIVPGSLFNGSPQLESCTLAAVLLFGDERYMNGRPSTPMAATEEQAAAVNAEIRNVGGGWDAAVQLLADAGDPETAQVLARNDWYRLRRALEILKITGKPRGSFPLPWTAANKPIPSDETDVQCEAKSTSPKIEPQHLDYDFCCYFLYMKRSELYRRLDVRCEQMLTDTQGLLQEASWLLDLGILPNSSPPSRAIGYRQTMEYLAACRLAGGVSSPKEFSAFLSGFQKASRNYAKRQLTWFRDEEKFRWLNASLPVEDIVGQLESEYHKSFGLCGPSLWEVEEKSTMVKEVKALKTYVAENR